jgi:hypothetical protein
MDVTATTEFEASVPISIACAGRCEVYVNGVVVLSKTEATTADLNAILPRVKLGVDVLAIQGFKAAAGSPFALHATLIESVVTPATWKCTAYTAATATTLPAAWHSNDFDDAAWEAGETHLTALDINNPPTLTGNVDGSFVACRFVPANTVVTKVTLTADRLEESEFPVSYADKDKTFSKVLEAGPSADARRAASTTVSSQTYKFELREMEEFVQYGFKANIATASGTHPTATTNTKRTAVAVPEAPVSNLVKFFVLPDPENQEQHSLRVHWDPVAPAHKQNGPIAFYLVEYTREEKVFVAYDQSIVTVPKEFKSLEVDPTVDTVTLTGLTPNSTYTIDVYPVTSRATGKGPESCIVLQTAVSAPRQPPVPELVTNGGDFVVIKTGTLSNETGEITKIWVVAEPIPAKLIPGKTTNPQLVEIVQLELDPSGKERDPLPPLPFPHEGVVNGRFTEYDPAKPCEKEYFGNSFRDRLNTSVICGGMCPLVCSPGTPMMDPNMLLPTNDQSLENDGFAMKFEEKRVDRNTGVVTTITKQRFVPYLTIKKRIAEGTTEGGLALEQTLKIGDGKINPKSNLHNILLNPDYTYRLRFVVFTSESLYAISDGLTISASQASAPAAGASVGMGIGIALLVIIVVAIILVLVQRRLKKRHDLFEALDQTAITISTAAPARRASAVPARNQASNPGYFTGSATRSDVLYAPTTAGSSYLDVHAEETGTQNAAMSNPGYFTGNNASPQTDYAVESGAPALTEKTSAYNVPQTESAQYSMFEAAPARPAKENSGYMVMDDAPTLPVKKATYAASGKYGFSSSSDDAPALPVKTGTYASASGVTNQGYFAGAAATPAYAASGVPQSAPGYFEVASPGDPAYMQQQQEEGNRYMALGGNDGGDPYNGQFLNYALDEADTDYAPPLPDKVSPLRP